jgi:DNA polymerase elongation subunit (family B)
MKILLLDIETSPNSAYVWGLYDQNIGINQMIESSQVLCYCAKWLGDKEVVFDSIHKSSRKKMLKGIHGLINEADGLVTYNGNKFDLPILNKEFLLHNLNPPSPSKKIDLLRTVRSNFRFTSNKLDYVSQQLGLGKKVEHEGFEFHLNDASKDGSKGSDNRQVATKNQRFTSMSVIEVCSNIHIFFLEQPRLLSLQCSFSKMSSKPIAKCASGTGRKKKIQHQHLYRYIQQFWLGGANQAGQKQ